MQAKHWLYPLLIVLGLVPLDLPARIKLTALPEREQVQIHLDHPQVALVEEQRVVALSKGLNQLDFAWANTGIAPETLLLHILPQSSPATLQAKVLSVSYPPHENALVWTIAASEAGAVTVRISYALDALRKEFHYRAVANHAEQHLLLTNYLRVINAANEAYDLAQFRSGVGALQFAKPLGLDETKELQIQQFNQVPLRKTYTVDVVNFGWLDRAQDKLNVRLHYVVENTGLAGSALPAGKARIFQDDGQGSTVFLGEDHAAFTPPQDELALYLGLARDVVVRRTVERSERQRIAGNLYRYDVTIKYAIENFKDSPLTLDIVESVRNIRDTVRGAVQQRDVEWQLGAGSLTEPDAEKSDADRLLFHVQVPAHPAPQPLHTLRLTLNNEW